MNQTIQVAVRQAALSTAKAAESYGKLLTSLCDNGKIDLQEAQEGFRALNHSSGALERMYRILKETESGTNVNSV